ncbi:acyl-CoA thioesterase [Renibacterium salmoninarum]|nr:thioesterase family protein [Renibacterium salmoninarum]
MSSVIQIPLQIRFGDIDSYGHVNNVQYIQFLEDARVQLMHAVLGTAAGAGASSDQCFNDLLDADQLTLVGRHEIEYLAPLTFRTQPVFVNIWITRIGTSSFDFGYTVAEQDGSSVYVQAASGMVLVSRTSGKPVALSGNQRHALETWLGSSIDFTRRPAAEKFVS